MNLKFNDILTIALKVPSVLVNFSSLVWFSSLSSSLLSSLELSKLIFIEYSITGRLNCHVGLSNLQNCEWLTEFILQRAKNDHNNRSSCNNTRYSFTLNVSRSQRSPLYLVELELGAFFPTFSQRVKIQMFCKRWQETRVNYFPPVANSKPQVAQIT